MRFGTGLKFAKYEHRWENYTNNAIISGLFTTMVAYYFDFAYTSEVGIASILVIGFCHLVARVGHKGEQITFKKYRSWRK